MYKISKLTGKLYFNDVEVVQDDRLKDFLDYLTYISNGGIVTEVDIIGSELDLISSYDYELTIKEKYQYLMLRALSSSMGKYGNYEYLQMQKLEYDDKYNVAKGIVNNIYVAEAIEKEMLRDFSEIMLDSILTDYGQTPTGTQLDKMYQLIIFRYEYAENRYNTFKGFIIDFRTKCRTFVENLEFNRLDSAFALVDSLPLELTDAEIQTFYTNFENI